MGKELAQVDGGGEPGYDHCFARAATSGGFPLAVIAELSDPESGRGMSVATDLPGVQLYT